MRVTPENAVKVTLMAVVGIALLRIAAARFGLSGLSALLGD